MTIAAESIFVASTSTFLILLLVVWNTSSDTIKVFVGEIPSPLVLLAGDLYGTVESNAINNETTLIHNHNYPGNNMSTINNNVSDSSSTTIHESIRICTTKTKSNLNQK